MKKIYLLPFVILIFLAGCSKDNGISNNAKDQINSNKNTIEKNSSKDSGTKENSKNEAKSESKTYFGEWEIEKLAFSSPVSAYSSDDIDMMMGKKLTFSEDHATCFGDKIDYLHTIVVNPKYIETSISKEEFLNAYKLTEESAKLLPDNITEVKVEESGETRCDFLVLDKDSLLLVGGGAFLLLHRVVSN